LRRAKYAPDTFPFLFPHIGGAVPRQERDVGSHDQWTPLVGLYDWEHHQLARAARRIGSTATKLLEMLRQELADALRAAPD
jgi:hypothetical protein